MSEVWREIGGYEGRFEISTEGRIRNMRTGRILKPSPRGWRGGYRGITLCSGGARRTISIHKLVLTTFVGPCPAGHEAAHDNNCPWDNRLANLAWKTARENNHDQDRHGTRAIGERHGCAKLTPADVIFIRQSGLSTRELMARFGVRHEAIQSARSGRKWRSITVPAVPPPPKWLPMLRARARAGGGER